MARSLLNGDLTLHKVTCVTCGREFRSTNPRPHVCPACRKRARGLKALKRVLRKKKK